MLVVVEIVAMQEDKKKVCVQLESVVFDRGNKTALAKFPCLQHIGSRFYIHGGSLHSPTVGDKTLLIVTTCPKLHYNELVSPDPSISSTMPLSYWSVPGAHAKAYAQLACNIAAFHTLYKRSMATARVDDYFTRWTKEHLSSEKRASPVVDGGPCSRCQKAVESNDHFFVQKASTIEECTFRQTGPSYVKQVWFKCQTCWPSPKAPEGVCVTCAEQCHAGHDLRQQKEGGFYCDCGSGAGVPAANSTNKQCQSLREFPKFCVDCARVVRFRHDDLVCVECPFDLKVPEKEAFCLAADCVMDYVRLHVLKPFGREAVAVSKPVTKHVYGDRHNRKRLVHVMEITFDAQKVGPDMPPLEPSIESNRKYCKDVNIPLFSGNVLQVWVLNCGTIRKWSLDGTFARAWTATQAKTDWKGIKEKAFEELGVSFGGLGMSSVFGITTGNTSNGQTGCCHTGTYVGGRDASRPAKGTKAWRVEQFMVQPMVVYEYDNRWGHNDINDF